VVSVVVLMVLTVCAVIATATWAAQAASGGLVQRDNALALAGWGVLSAAAGVVGQVTGRPTHPGALVLLLLAAGCAVVGVSGAARPVTATTGLAPAAAEATLVAGSVVSLFWAFAGTSTGGGLLSWSALGWVTLTTVDLLTAALIVRIPVVAAATADVVPDDRTPSAFDHRYRPLVRTGVAALVLLGLSDALLTVAEVRGAVGVDVGLGVRAVAYLVAAAVPFVPPAPARPTGAARITPRAQAPRWARALPYLLVGAAVTALIAAAFAGNSGPVSLLLVALVVCGLAAVQGLALRENARLLHDLADSRSRLVALVENTSDVILGIDAIGRVVSANAAASRLLHRRPDVMTGLEVGELAVPEHRAALRAAVDDVVHHRRATHRVEVRLAPPATGSAELRMRAVADGVVANLSDVTEAVRLRERLERLSRYDEMTGLANRVHLLAEITGWLRAGLPVAVLYCDLDGFKAVNDRFGHLAGDDVLAEAARRLQDVAAELPGERALVARIGGDEFVMALVRTPEMQLTTATDLVLASMRPTFPVADRAVRVGLSVGVAASWDTGRPPGLPPGPAPLDGDADDLLHRADVAMFAAKQAGRFQAVRWDPAIQARALRRVDIAIGLRRALDSHRLALAYQPLVRLSDGAVVGVEALLRVEPGDDAPGALAGLPDLVSPAELVEVAEDTGEITEVGHWVITEATLQAARWLELGHDVFVTVNVSVRQLATEGIVEFVRDALATARLPASALVVEITEGQLLTEGDPAWDAVGQLRAMGVMLVIDDFGTGYSSLAYLRRMPVRGVKLDKALLADLATDSRARTLARAVIAAARALGLLVVAEGLETVEAARIVRDLGVWAGQGFALYEGMPADDVTAVLAAPPAGLGAPRPVPRRAGGPGRPDGGRPDGGRPGGATRSAGPRVVDLTRPDVHGSVPADLT